MRIAELTFVNFRCFGAEPTVVALEPLTALVGSNGCGKSALLLGLVRLFGTSPHDRLLRPEDFHVQDGTTRDELSPSDMLTLSIEAKLSFPELDGDDDDLDTSGVAPCFSQMMVVDEEDGPFCTVRLEGTWTKGNVPEGEVEQKLFWIRPGKGADGADQKLPMEAHQRSMIHVHYLPATRDPSRQIRHVSGTIIHRLFSAVTWSDEIKERIRSASASVDSAFSEEPGVTAIDSRISEQWSRLHDSVTHRSVKLRPLTQRFEDLLRNMRAFFSPSPTGDIENLDCLSDGLKSLFYFTLTAAGFGLESAAVKMDEDLEGAFDVQSLDPPSLTLFAVEEPENHIAPHYLGRVISLQRTLLDTQRCQILMSSHSPAIMRRVEPSEVRHIRRDPESGVSVVNALSMPTEDEEAIKYVNEAVRAFPELYFARLVVLGEGDSEELMLPRIAEAQGIKVDHSLISVVPLGGRHVNHFWRLLDDLDIPHITLLDLDRERFGGGWWRIEYALKQLLARGTNRRELLKLADGSHLKPSELDDMGSKDESLATEQAYWIQRLEEHNVYFSAPLDFDFLMLEAFPKAYQNLEDSEDGPQIPKDKSTPKAKVSAEAVILAVLKERGGDGSTYNQTQQEAFYWYRYRFLGRSKPVSHLRAITYLTPKALKKECPEVLKRFCAKMAELLASTDMDD